MCQGGRERERERWIMWKTNLSNDTDLWISFENDEYTSDWASEGVARRGDELLVELSGFGMVCIRTYVRVH